ncbi:DNA cytosine methyltransferase [Vallitalea maricola]|uniref:DNA cytosine methyltransferase n=1 Tax=Vallitalea maricola TaxID=3074433 RepID=A0ACB5UMV6_9FIRM|nr:DNA cytosine methyltransferase [Vallitalea sp. AN17-2]
MKQMTLNDIENYELIVDNFAGGGGASVGIEMALGRTVDIAINHDPAAIAMHRANHPFTKHYCESVWEVDPVEVTKGKKVGLAWFSPDCKHFSKAKGGKPKNKKIRGLAWVAVKWASFVKPRVIILENVEEFKTWGPLDEEGNVIKEKKGETFNHFIKALQENGYKVEYRELRACDYGAQTTRKRFFLIARSDGKRIIWTEATYGNPETIQGKNLKPWRTAVEIIDWSIPCPSIFNRKRPLAENTMKRIAKGIKKFVIDNPKPYIVRSGQTGFDKDSFITPFILTYHTETRENEVRGQELDKPITTIDGSNRYAIVAAFLIKYYGCDIGQKLNEPLHTITSKDRFGLITIKNERYKIIDIGLRMLQPRELFNAQGFPPDYIIEKDHKDNKYPKSAQVARCGNAVPPPFAKALVEANLPELIELNDKCAV